MKANEIHAIFSWLKTKYEYKKEIYYNRPDGSGRY